MAEEIVNAVRDTFSSREDWDADELYAQLEELPPERVAEVLDYTGPVTYKKGHHLAGAVLLRGRREAGQEI